MTKGARAADSEVGTLKVKSRDGETKQGIEAELSTLGLRHYSKRAGQWLL